ncbi:hypothetical protein G6F46_005264 [Rhizopus delemar]|uniref:Uncharacterized protein n=1 Tax=Rhizopus oryzae TaxID=64495 RepID=A0A9P6YEJ4_RHIOR|nr:hypothetical protein G6F51_005392 [Rhizopus arrhizus]KAG1616667.1 hypothetical protein G6F46_005264 [Rhizopus delemar]KAG1647223.1 hypothetical protein G6F44_000066 [Rhizopus delemar]
MIGKPCLAKALKQVFDALYIKRKSRTGKRSNITINYGNLEKQRPSEIDSNYNSETGARLEEFDSFTTDESDYSYQTEGSNNHVEKMTNGKYIMTLQQVEIEGFDECVN